MNLKLKALEAGLKSFKESPDTDKLNALRSNIFDYKNNGDIVEKSKNKLLKELYLVADEAGIFYIRIMDKKPGLPKDEAEEIKRELEAEQEEEEDEEFYEEFYEESWEESYDEDED